MKLSVQERKYPYSYRQRMTRQNLWPDLPVAMASKHCSVAAAVVIVVPSADVWIDHDIF